MFLSFQNLNTWRCKDSVLIARSWPDDDMPPTPPKGKGKGKNKGKGFKGKGKPVGLEEAWRTGRSVNIGGGRVRRPDGRTRTRGRGQAARRAAELAAQAALEAEDTLTI